MVSINGQPILLISLAAWGIYRFLVFKHAGRLHLLREIVTNLFFIYGCSVCSFTFFPIDISLFGFNLQDINLIPLVQTFRYLSHLEEPLALRNLLGNLALLAPLGIFLPLLFRKFRKFGAVIGVGFLATLGIEVFQLLLRFRVFDIDDLIINTLGVALGYGLFRLLQLLPFLRRWMDRITNTKIPGEGGYFIVFSGVVLTVFLGIFYFVILRNTESQKMILKQPFQQEQQLDNFQFGDYMIIFSESADGGKNIHFYRKVIFDRYTAVSSQEELDLQAGEFTISGNAYGGKDVDYFAIARSDIPIAGMMSGDRQFPIANHGDYYFSFARLPLDQTDAYYSFRFVDVNGDALDLTQDS